MSGKQWVNELQNLVFEYDFAVHGGAIGTIKLGDLPDNFIVKAITVAIGTTITSGGVPTLEIGEDGGGDANGYVEDFGATLTAESAIKGTGALITDDFHKVDAAKDGVQLTIGANALTAGKFKVIATGFQV
jgi:hypothetical protein